MLTEFENKGKKVWVDFKAGSEQAFEQLYKLYSKDMYRYGFQYSEKVELIEDAIHDVFLQLYKLRQRLPDLDNPKFYLFIAMRNALRNTYKTKEMFIDFLQLDSINPIDDISVESQMIESEEEKSRFKMLSELQRNLTEKERIAIYYRIVEDLSYADIALIMDVKEQSAKNMVHRTLNKIRTLLK